MYFDFLSGELNKGDFVLRLSISGTSTLYLFNEVVGVSKEEIIVSDVGGDISYDQNGKLKNGIFLGEYSEITRKATKEESEKYRNITEDYFV